MRKRHLLALIPLALGGLIATIMSRDPSAIPVLSSKIDLATLILLVGIFLSILVFFALVSWDRGERIRRQVIREASEDRRNFLRRLDHELKNPITAILMGVANLTNTAHDPDSKVYIDSIESHAARLSALTSALRRLADLERQPLAREKIDLCGLLKETFDLVTELQHADGKNLSLIMPEAPWPLPKITGDRDLLQLAIHNLLDNSLKYSRSDDTVELRAHEDGSHVVIEVADTGRGIPSTDLPNIWQELYRGQNALSIPGSGLGLPLTKSIVEQHGGTIVLRSRMGEGTVVTVRIPLS
ncbi:MAG: HAMP domain-containing sensor histidine kinase [Chloroflexota bacterium]|nr:HAMP domain-containing sensor histidine kinase [Chloroflexota bacterium]